MRGVEAPPPTGLCVTMTMCGYGYPAICRGGYYPPAVYNIEPDTNPLISQLRGQLPPRGELGKDISFRESYLLMVLKP